jgi:ribosomal protein S18 acetylase RimI-like enzyme
VLIRDVIPAADAELARALLRVQRAAYVVEAALIHDDQIPPLHEDLDDLRQAPLRWLVAVIDDQLSGAVAWKQKADEFDIDRLFVAPSAHRRGVGLALVGEVLRRAGTRRTTVSTGRGNGPARALYERLGFCRVNDREVIPGLWVTQYLHVRSGTSRRRR